MEMFVTQLCVKGRGKLKFVGYGGMKGIALNAHAYAQVF